MINILFEGMTENRGGKEAYIMNMFRAFDKTRYAFSFIACDKVIAYEEEIFAAGARIPDVTDYLPIAKPYISCSKRIILMSFGQTRPA